jgi:hypothetical protein
MNRGIAAAGGIALFVAGIGVGLFLRPKSTDPTASLRPAAVRSGSKEEGSSNPGRDEEPAQLHRRVRELEAELGRTREQPPTSPRPETPVESPELLFRDYVELEKIGTANADPEKVRVLFGRLSRLDERSAEFFIEKFRQSGGPDQKQERSVAMELALVCGGSATADFINLLLNDSGLDPVLRLNLLHEISGLSGSFFSIRRLPVNDALTASATALSQSEKATDRQGSAGLLGGVCTDASRAELCRLLEFDPDWGVKTAAAISLGHAGDPATRTFLESYWRSKLPTLKGPEGSRLKGAIESAMKALAESR